MNKGFFRKAMSITLAVSMMSTQFAGMIPMVAAADEVTPDVVVEEYNNYDLPTDQAVYAYESTVGTVEVAQWATEAIEIVADIPSGSNPYMDTAGKIVATFTHSDGTELVVRAYYADNGKWIVNFAPSKVGTWTYTVAYDEANVIDGHDATAYDTAYGQIFDGLTGTISCVANDNENMHGGMVQNPDYLDRVQYQDGTDAFIMGWEVDWMGIISQGDDDISKAAELIDNLAAAGITEVIMNAFGWDTSWCDGVGTYISNSVISEYVDDIEGYNWGPTTITPWLYTGTATDSDYSNDSNTDFTIMNEEYWSRYEEVVAYMTEKGITAHILWKVRNKSVNWDETISGTPKDTDVMYARYTADRLGAYNVIFDLGKECYSLGTDASDYAYISRMAEEFAYGNGYDRMITVHDYDNYYNSLDEDEAYELFNMITDQYHNMTTYTVATTWKESFPDLVYYQAETNYQWANNGYYQTYRGNTNEHSPENAIWEYCDLFMSGSYSAHYYTVHAWDIVKYDEMPYHMEYYTNLTTFANDIIGLDVWNQMQADNTITNQLDNAKVTTADAWDGYVLQWERGDPSTISTWVSQDDVGGMRAWASRRGMTIDGDGNYYLLFTGFGDDTQDSGITFDTHSNLSQLKSMEVYFEDVTENLQVTWYNVLTGQTVDGGTVTQTGDFTQTFTIPLDSFTTTVAETSMHGVDKSGSGEAYFLYIAPATDSEPRTVTSVAAVADISVDYGTEFAALGLPGSVVVTLDNDTTKTVTVSWDSADYSAIAGTYTLTGTLTNLAYYIDANDMTASVTVTVGEQKTVTDITAPAAFEVDYGTTAAELDLPATVDVALSDGTTIAVAVTWSCDSYATTAGSYTFVGSLGTLPASVAATSDTVSVVVTVAELVVVDITAVTAPAATTAAYSTAAANVELPATVEVTLADGTTTELAVTWTAPADYDGLSVGSVYTFAGALTLVETVANPNGLTVSVDVTILEQVTTVAGIYLEYFNDYDRRTDYTGSYPYAEPDTVNVSNYATENKGHYGIPENVPLTWATVTDTINGYWATGSNIAGTNGPSVVYEGEQLVNANYFAMRYTAILTNLDYTGTYYFQLNTNDGKNFTIYDEEAYQAAIAAGEEPEALANYLRWNGSTTNAQSSTYSGSSYGSPSLTDGYTGFTVLDSADDIVSIALDAEKEYRIVYEMVEGKDTAIVQLAWTYNTTDSAATTYLGVSTNTDVDDSKLITTANLRLPDEYTGYLVTGYLYNEDGTEAGGAAITVTASSTVARSGEVVVAEATADANGFYAVTIPTTGDVVMTATLDDTQVSTQLTLSGDMTATASVSPMTLEEVEIPTVTGTGATIYIEVAEADVATGTSVFNLMITDATNLKAMFFTLDQVENMTVEGVGDFSVMDFLDGTYMLAYAKGTDDLLTTDEAMLAGTITITNNAGATVTITSVQVSDGSAVEDAEVPETEDEATTEDIFQLAAAKAELIAQVTEASENYAEDDYTNVGWTTLTALFEDAITAINDMTTQEETEAFDLDALIADAEAVATLRETYDLNGDTVISYSDIVCITPYYGYEFEAGDALSKYDVNGTGFINSDDYLTIYQNMD